MSDDNKEKNKTFEYPMMPIYGVDLGRELGDLAAGQRQLNARMDKLEARFDALDAKTDKMVVAINRLDERLTALSEGRKSDHALLVGLWVTVIAGFILQFFIK